MERIPEVELIAAMVLGWLSQKFIRATETSNLWAWAAMVLASLAFWFWATPGAVESLSTDWRRALVSIVMFALAAEGSGRATADAKLAPPTIR